MSRFEDCLARILKHEGGYVNDPLDSGGRTNLGVTQRVWEEFVGHPVTEADMKALTPEKIAPMYKLKYWNPSYCEVLPKGLDYVVFDFAVNAGTGRSVKTLQQAIGCVADGVIGPKTMALVKQVPARQMIIRFSEQRRMFYKSLKAFETFGRGWLRRTDECESKAIEMTGDQS